MTWNRRLPTPRSAGRDSVLLLVVDQGEPQHYEALKVAKG